MGYSQKEIGIVRDLVKQYMEVAMSEKHIRMRKRFCDTNDLLYAWLGCVPGRKQ